MKSMNGGSNVSILQIRNTSEPWTAQNDLKLKPHFFINEMDNTTRTSSKIHYTDNDNYDQCLSRTFGSFKNSTSNSLKYEKFSQLSPIRWRNKKVDGVYLEANGWVKVRRNFNDIVELNQNRYNNTSDYSYDSCSSQISGLSSEESEYSTSPESPIISPPLAFQDKIIPEIFPKNHNFRKVSNGSLPEFDTTKNYKSVYLNGNITPTKVNYTNNYYCINSDCNSSKSCLKNSDNCEICKNSLRMPIRSLIPTKNSYHVQPLSTDTKYEEFDDEYDEIYQNLETLKLQRSMSDRMLGDRNKTHKHFYNPRSGHNDQQNGYKPRIMDDTILVKKVSQNRFYTDIRIDKFNRNNNFEKIDLSNSRSGHKNNYCYAEKCKTVILKERFERQNKDYNYYDCHKTNGHRETINEPRFENCNCDQKDRKYVTKFLDPNQEAFHSQNRYFSNQNHSMTLQKGYNGVDIERFETPNGCAYDNRRLNENMDYNKRGIIQNCHLHNYKKNNLLYNNDNDVKEIEYQCKRQELINTNLSNLNAQIEQNRMKRYQWFLNETVAKPDYLNSKIMPNGKDMQKHHNILNSEYNNNYCSLETNTGNGIKNNQEIYKMNQGCHLLKPNYENIDFVNEYKNELSSLQYQNDKYSDISLPMSYTHQLSKGILGPCIEEIKRKSSSLPKSFQRDNIFRKEIKRNSSRRQFEWCKNVFTKGLVTKKAIGTSTVMSETAPTTPVRDMPEKKRCGRLMKLNQYSSTPALDDNLIQHINFDCDTRYLFKDNSYSNKTKVNRPIVVNSNNEIQNGHTACQANAISGSNLGDRVFHKFCKSFSWRFLKKQNEIDRGDINNESNGYERLVDDSPSKKHHKFGPLSWRCSKERKEKLHHTVSMPAEDAESVSQDKVPEIISKPDNQTSVRRTLSDLNGYHDVIKHKTACSVVPTRYRPSVPVVLRKQSSYKLRRTVSLPVLSGFKISPTLSRKAPPVEVAHSEDERGLFSEDDMMSDSGSSVPSRKASLEQGINEEIVIFAEAVWDHIAIESEELPFRAGDVIEVYNALNKDWWWGTCNGKSGWFSSDFVRLRVSQEDSLQDRLGSYINKSPVSNSVYSNEQIRSRVVRELINTERDFVKILKDISEAYISECKLSEDLFTSDQLFTIFGNWEQLFSFQSSFLKSLESNMHWEMPHKTCIGSTFLRHQADFRMYSDYCNNHPLSMATLQQLYQNSAYRAFFEKCRIKGGLIEIPLDGFLLTPVQRICKYPLQLAELLKYTDVEHDDYKDIQAALDAMRDVAVLINERKRRMESFEKLILWQQRVQEWEGDDLIDHSSQLLYQNEVSKLATGVFITNATMFLFDHQLIYCKKDILKRNHYIYKGRMILDNSDIMDVPDGKDNVLGFNVRNGIKIQNSKLHKWMVFCCRTQKEKTEWLEAFSRERNLVSHDEQNKLEISVTDRQLAYITANTCNRRHAFVKHSNKKLKRAVSRNARMSRGSSHLLGRKMGTWFMFGANRKNYRRVNRSQHS